MAPKGRARKRAEVGDPPAQTSVPAETEEVEDEQSPHAEETTEHEHRSTNSVPRPQLPPIGARARHRVLQVYGVVAQHAASADFMHKGKVLLRYGAVEKKVTVVKSMWCSSAELEVLRSSPRSSPEKTPAPRSAKVASVRPFKLNNLVEDDEMAEVASEAPELAAHERGRMVMQKSERKETASSTKWGHLGAHKTAQTKVSLEQRVKEFPDQSIIVTETTRGRVLFCQCCPKELQNIKETIKTHVSSERHAHNLIRWTSRKKGDNSVLEFLHEYFKSHPSEKDSTVTEELQLFRWRVVEACLYAGIPISKVDHLRELLERSGQSLSGSAHLMHFVSKIERFEYDRLVKELNNRKVCLIYDGTTRHGECTAVIMRWCSDSFEIHQRLVALRTVQKHMHGDSLGPFLIDLIGQMGVRSSSIVCTARDSCSTNGKAERNIQPILSQSTGMMCISHTLSHTAEHADLPTLKEFMTPWISLVQHHPSAKNLWRTMIGSSMKGFSTIRWFSREEVCNELAENYGSLQDFMEQLIEDEIGDAHPRKMASILANQKEELRLELACNLDLKPLLTACYSLEGTCVMCLNMHELFIY